ncbi:hypothetical protein LTR85_003700 [Meristemomyces frigidus]|nr:hypothetical protein LTR85_003700 [Meristemomyces frigidus]
MDHPAPFPPITRRSTHLAHHLSTNPPDDCPAHGCLCHRRNQKKQPTPTTTTTTPPNEHENQNENPFADPPPLRLPVLLRHVKVTPYTHTSYIHRETLETKKPRSSVVIPATATYDDVLLGLQLLAVFAFPKLDVAGGGGAGAMMVIERHPGSDDVDDELWVDPRSTDWGVARKWLGRKGARVRFEFEARKAIKSLTPGRVEEEPSSCTRVWRGVRGVVGKVCSRMCARKPPGGAVARETGVVRSAVQLRKAVREEKVLLRSNGD